MRFGTVIDWETTYNDILNITGLKDNGAQSLYDYDGLNHLTDAQYPASSGLTNESYVYDRVGNRKDAGNLSAYDYDINHRIKNSPELTYTFDTAGNLTSRSDGTEYGYNLNNRLKQLSTSDSSAEYTYDPLGRRIKKSVNGIHTWFIWDGTRLLAETNENGTVLRQYIHAGDLPVALYEPGNENVSNCIDPDAVLTNIVVGAEQSFNCNATNSITTAENGLVVLEGGTAVLAAPEITLGTGVDIQEGGKLSANTVVNTTPEGGESALYAIHTDHLGTPRYLSNSNASIIWRWQSDAFGSTLADEDPDGDGQRFVFNLRFPGQYFDGESGLYYNYFRYYDPSIGRYITSDPIGLNAGVNTYAYVESNPINFFDSFGLSPEDVNKILDQYKKSVNHMIQNGQRRPGGGWLNGVLNNAQGYWQNNGYLQCYDQAINVMDNIRQLQLDDKWDLNLIGAPPHYKGELISDNPSDPMITIDPWVDKVQVGYATKYKHPDPRVNPWVDFEGNVHK